LFTPLALKERIFQRSESILQWGKHLDFPPYLPESVERPRSVAAGAAPAPASRRWRNSWSMRFSPPAVLVNEQGDILYVSGRTGQISGTGGRQGQLERHCHGPRGAAL
jgi:hypothetical protein